LFGACLGGRLDAGSLKMMTKMMKMLCAFFEEIEVVAE
jgi:hypothetical protein